VITLANNDPSATPHPRNGREFDAVRHVITLGLENLFLLAFKRKNWGLMKDASSLSPLLELIFLWSLLLGTGVGALGGLVGSLLGEGIARDANADAIKDKMWWSIPQCILTTVYWLFLQQEGSTQSGTFTPRTPRHRPARTSATGENTSPYKRRSTPPRSRGATSRRGTGPLQPQLQQRQPDLLVRPQPRRGLGDPRGAIRHRDRVLESVRTTRASRDGEPVAKLTKRSQRARA
jgi:hypothetical protein